MSRLLSLAAASVLDAGPAATLRAAAGAGYDAVGLRLAPGTRGADLRELADDLGLVVLDLEVARLGPDRAPAEHLRLLELAHTLGARHLLAVSSHESEQATVDELGALCAAAAGGPTRVALEFMRFTEVRGLAAAARIAGATGAVVLVDALHLARGGEEPAAVAALDPALLGYLQLCDAPGEPPSRDLAEEARHHRLPPGEGELPLRALLAHTPADLPVSVEVPSDRLAATLPPPARARHLLAATRRVLDGALPRPDPVRTPCAPR